MIMNDRGPECKRMTALLMMRGGNLAEMKHRVQDNDHYSIATRLLPFARIFLASMRNRCPTLLRHRPGVLTRSCGICRMRDGCGADAPCSE
jgi:hypothetical protein